MLRGFFSSGKGASEGDQRYARAAAELYELAVHGVVIPRHFVVSPGSAQSVQFCREISRLMGEMQDAGDSPSAVRSVRERLERSCKQFARWQNSELDRLIDSFSDSIQHFVSSLQGTIGDQEEVIEHMGALQSNLKKASEATNLEQAKSALTEHAMLLQRALEQQQKIQRGLREEYEASVRALEAQLKVAEAASRTDHLTRVSNRAAFDEHLVETIERVKRGDSPYSIAVFDLDGFKPINDRLGHQAGDIALKEFAAALRSMFGKDGFVARLGGDEFAVIVKWPQLQLQKATQQFQVALVKRQISLTGDAGGKITLATSVGVTTIAADDDDKTVLARADEALYEMKRRFGNGRAA